MYHTERNNHGLVSFLFSIISDVNSERFQQPRMDENESEFCPLTMVFNKEYGYVDQDRMIIKIIGQTE